jgi:hypothetical protein
MTKESTVSLSIIKTTAITGILLLIPFMAQMITSEVNWTLSDFIAAGTMIFGIGIGYVLISRQSDSMMYRIASGLTLFTALFLIWVNLAVGVIGSEDNVGNLMFFGVVLVLLIGILAARLRARGMALALFTTALTQAATVPAALIYDMQSLPGSSVMEILLINGMYTALFLISGGLYWRVSESNELS